MNTIVMNFSNIYTLEDFYKTFEYRYIDLSNIDGTNCYCDEEACSTIKNALRKEYLSAIHFIDSGNYHYITNIWIERITQPFNLIVFDNHTDMQEPQFGDILSCGGWIKKSLDTNLYINKVYLIGVRPDLAIQIPTEYNNKIICYDRDNLPKDITISSDLPLYISIDKDALSPLEAATNWDQGEIRLDYLEHIISSITKKTEVLGIDICGEPDYDDVKPTDIGINNLTNRRLIDFFNSL